VTEATFLDECLAILLHTSRMVSPVGTYRTSRFHILCEYHTSISTWCCPFANSDWRYHTDVEMISPSRKRLERH
jgi:hypothetical protein